MDLSAKIKAAKTLAKSGSHAEALEAVGKILSAGLDFSVQHRLSKIVSAISLDALELAPLKIAIVPTSTVESFEHIFKMWLAVAGFAPEIFMAEYDTLQATVLDPNSELYSFDPDIVWLYTGNRDIREMPSPGAGEDEISACIGNNIDSLVLLWETIRSRCSAYIVQNNADIPLERTFGNFEASVPWSRQNFLRRHNYELARAVIPGVTIFDLDYLATSFGKKNWYSPRYWYHSKHTFSFDAIGEIACAFSRLAGAIKGKMKKCLVLDLDNTLWGGVIGDDGLEGIKLGNGADGEAFVDFQKYILSLKNRGVILAVCSKNEEENAQLPFREHPDMVLKLEDIAAFTANWNNKADNIKDIAATLDIGIDSLVFVDDNPYERNLVKELVPEVKVPDLPEDPALYTPFLDSLGLFETISFSREDGSRSDMYRGNVERRKHAAKIGDLDDYLKDLEMVSQVGLFDDFNLPRIAQLINKSNQFHLTTTRYTESQIIEFMNDAKCVCVYFRLKDKFGDNGLISAVIMKKSDDVSLHIDTWVMSCRVLSRGMEEFIQSELMGLAKKSGCSRITGKYIPTKKNKLVSGLYERLGYNLVSDEDGATIWEMELAAREHTLKTFVSKSPDSGTID